MCCVEVIIVAYTKGKFHFSITFQIQSEFHFALDSNTVIATKLCVCHNSTAVMACAIFFL